MRIAYAITRADAVGGASVHVRDLACAMRARGHDVLVLIGGTGPVTDELAGAGVPFRPLTHLRRSISAWSDTRAIGEVAAALREFQPHLVSAHTAKAGWIARAACAWLKIPAIYTPHGLSVGSRAKTPLRTLARLAERAAGRWNHDIVCVCEAERQLALASHIASQERLHLIYNGVHDVAPGLRASPAGEPCRVVSVARFEEPKDHGALLEAMSRLQDLDWELELVGDGPLEMNCRALAARLGIADRTRFLGYRPDPASALARASLFVLSSRSEALPRSVLEAMRAGLPIVASAVGGLPETVDNGSNGVLIPKSDVGALALAIREMIQDGHARAAYGRASRTAYEARFRFDFMLEKTGALYETVRERTATS
ncbi:MAG: glycosyltransferase family 4 protein [Bryobacteraceae bacterium]|jgi:glycosyltransferase involved in cell wall biosynthesis